MDLEQEVGGEQHRDNKADRRQKRDTVDDRSCTRLPEDRRGQEEGGRDDALDESIGNPVGARVGDLHVEGSRAELLADDLNRVDEPALATKPAPGGGRQALLDRLRRPDFHTELLPVALEQRHDVEVGIQAVATSLRARS